MNKLSIIGSVVLVVMMIIVGIYYINKLGDIVDVKEYFVPIPKYENKFIALNPNKFYIQDKFVGIDKRAMGLFPLYLQFTNLNCNDLEI